jgi:hypothetical protein
MSAQLEMSPSVDQVEFPYRAMSSLAIASLVFAFLAGLLGLFVWPGLSFALIGIATGAMAINKIRAYPNEFDGLQIAIAGVLLNVAILVGGAGMHAFIYLTEVPEGYSRVPFYALQQPDNGPPAPTDAAIALDGQSVFLKGYIHPSSGSGLLKHFILVPDLGTCCFGGQPKSSDMVEVTLTGGQTTKAGFRKKKLAGTFKVNQAPQQITDFDNRVFYRMQVDQIK